VLLHPKDQNLARQNPADHLHGLAKSSKFALAQAIEENGFDARKVIGFAAYTIGSSPFPYQRNQHPVRP
jgi:hypothetical protein